MENILPFESPALDAGSLSPDQIKQVKRIMSYRPDISFDDAVAILMVPIFEPDDHTPYLETIQRMNDDLQSTHLIDPETGRYVSDVVALQLAASDIAANQIIQRMKPIETHDVDMSDANNDELSQSLVSSRMKSRTESYGIASQIANELRESLNEQTNETA